MKLYDSFPAPATTRFIRIQLIAIRHVGDDNAGYFDNISLMAAPVNSFNMMLVLINAGIEVLVAESMILAYRKKNKKKEGSF